MRVYLGLAFAIVATLAGAGGGVFGRKQTPPPAPVKPSIVYYKPVFQDYKPSPQNDKPTTGEKRRYSF